LVLPAIFSRASGSISHRRTSTYLALDLLLRKSILEDRKVLDALGSWVFWIHEDLWIEQVHIFHIVTFEINCDNSKI
jgi:hypothetical protein